jgi:hypothetical protein
VQPGYETKCTSSANKHFFTISCNPQAYHNYEESRQKLSTILENKGLKTSKFSKKSSSPDLLFFHRKINVERFH